MLDIVLVVVGFAIVLAVLYDLVATTVSLSAVRGPVSTRISALLGSIGSRPSSRRLAPLQRVLGPALLIGILVGWLTTLALGWSLVFRAEGALALASTTDEPQQSSDVRWSTRSSSSSAASSGPARPTSSRPRRGGRPRWRCSPCRG